jgi:DNA repair protein RadD
MQLRDYQVEALNSLRAEMSSGKRRLVLVAPTGSGKTAIACAMISGALSRNLRSLFLVHRRELVEQAWARMRDEGINAGVIMAGWQPSSAPVQVASIQTLARRHNPPAGLVIVDEAHHAVSESYAVILRHYSESFVVGLTASPWRLDGRGLGDIFESSVVAATPKKLIDGGYLCDYQGFKYVAPDTGRLSVRNGDYVPSEVAECYRSTRLVGEILDRWQTNARGLRSILFAPSIDSSRDFCARFIAAGARAEHLDFKTPPQLRRAVMDRVRSGETQVLCNVSLVTEGVDVPELQCAILARPTKSLALYLQMVGRVLRPKADGGKALILDHSENIARHGLPDAPRDYSLSVTKPKDSVPPLRTCKFCLAIWEPPPMSCPNCGQTQPGVEREGPDTVDGYEVDIRAPDDTPERYKRQLVETAIAKGYAPGWVVHRYLEKYPGSPKPWGAYREVKKATADRKEGWMVGP